MLLNLPNHKSVRHATWADKSSDLISIVRHVSGSAQKNKITKKTQRKFRLKSDIAEVCKTLRPTKQPVRASPLLLSSSFAAPCSSRSCPGFCTCSQIRTHHQAHLPPNTHAAASQQHRTQPPQKAQLPLPDFGCLLCLHSCSALPPFRHDRRPPPSHPTIPTTPSQNPATPHLPHSFPH